ncbi:MAG: 50S ribosomal protein L25, partial [Bacteroidota bacterium]
VLPDTIPVDISKLQIGDSVKVGQMQAQGLEFLDPASSVVVNVKMTRGAGAAGGDDEEAEAEGTETTEPAAE